VSQIRLYVDEDAMAVGLVNSLRLRGIDTVTVRDAGMVQRSDEDHLSSAAEEGRTVYTFNLPDFCRLHMAWMAASRSHAGIVVVPQQRYSIGEQLRMLLRLISTISAEEMKGRVEFLSNWG
jgi:uncharacterized protein with PIN domain